MKTDNGDIYTDFDVTVDPTAPPVVADVPRGRARAKAKAETKAETKAAEKESKAGVRRRVHVDGSTVGTINGGGPDMQFTTFNGRIVIHKK
jgi:hypothetical protein